MTVYFLVRQFRLSQLGLLSCALSCMLVMPEKSWAVSPFYGGFVKQVPPAFTLPPDVNVMLTLDNSGSMWSDAIPNFDIPGADYSLLPSGGSYEAGPKKTPWMWFDFRIRGRVNAINRSDFMAYSNYFGAGAQYMRSSAGNPLYYNPQVTYRPWPKPNDNSQRLPPADPSRVIIHPTTPWIEITPTVPGDQPNILDLTTALIDSGRLYWPAAYYVYRGTNALPHGRPDSPLNVASNFTRYVIPGTGNTTFPRAGSRTDCTGPVGNAGCSRTEELQNFANWLQYYRSRSLMSKGAIAEALAAQASNIRVGLSLINGDLQRGVRKFVGPERAALFDLLYNAYGESGTPLRNAMDNVGQYFQTTGINSPWAEAPSQSVGTEYSCRRSFHFLSSDGFWDSSPAMTIAAQANNDDFSGTTTPASPTGLSYTYSDSSSFSNDPLAGRFTIHPFADNPHPNRGSLSDVAAYYWKTDLRPDLPNNVAPTSRDPAFWQHMSTYTIGLGITGSGRVTDASGNVVDLSTQVDRDLLVTAKTQLNWTIPTDSDEEAKGDDLIHASMSSRGRYFMANDPVTLAANLSAALAEVANQPLAFAALASKLPAVESGAFLYQATVNPSGWFGRLYAFAQANDGTIDTRPTDATYLNPTQPWEASLAMPSHGSRNIYTLASALGPGVRFTWNNLNATQQASLNNDVRLVDYVRGSSQNEISNGGTFRDRIRDNFRGISGGVLGDIVGGSPLVGPPLGGGYERLPPGDPAGPSYDAFRNSSTLLENHKRTIFVGANDGMLHAFNAVSGVERFAYVPNAVYSVPRSTPFGATENKLAMLSDPGYTHRFTVDGPSNIADAYINSQWRSYLSASFGAGARGIYTLDVTDPEVGGTGKFNENSIKWEFTEANNNNVGFVPGYPHIVRMRNGRWAALFGNGPDSVNGAAGLFVVDLATGSLINSLLVSVVGNNGLMQPNFILNPQREVETVYAGDLRGNLWKFDLSSTNPADWHVSFGGNPLFKAVSANGDPQPISVMPEITRHTHSDGGAMLTFGTGKLFEESDTLSSSANVNLLTQTIYGVWDKPGLVTPTYINPGNRSSLFLAQTAPTIAANEFFGSSSTFEPNWSNQLGWFMDLGPGGERVNLPAQQVKEVLFVVANKPISDPCANNGSAKVFALDPVTGKGPSFAVFDVNGDGAFDQNSEKGVNVRAHFNGILSQPVFQLSRQIVINYPASRTTPFILFDRGQASAGRAGGVELLRTSGGTLIAPDPCSVLATAGLSDTNAATLGVRVCGPAPAGGPPRTTWRQIR